MTTPGKKPDDQSLVIHIVAKPNGPRCNLDCDYCFYLEKQALFPMGEDYMMPDDVLQTYIEKYIYIRKYLHTITQFLENGLPAFHIMEACKGPLVINVNK